MNRNEVAGNWKQLRGRFKEKWGELTDDELDRSEGRQDRLVGLIQERYGKTQDEADREVSDFFQKADRG